MSTEKNKNVEIDLLHFEDNPRQGPSLKIPEMVDKIRRNGFKRNHPIVVSQQDDGKYKVLVGNRRSLASQWLRDNDPTAYAELFPSGKIPAIVCTGLTQEEEILRRIDHGADEDREPLDEWSMFLAIQQLVQALGDSQEKIAIHLGLFHTKGKNKGKPNRSFVQPRVNLARLPRFVQDEMRKYCADANSTPLRWSHLATLYKSYNQEFLEYSDGSGPLLQAAWKKIFDDAKEKAESPETAGKALSAKDAKERAQAMDSVLLKQALLASTKQGTADLASIDRKITEGEEAVKVVQALREYLGEDDYNAMVVKAMDMADAVNEEAAA